MLIKLVHGTFAAGAPWTRVDSSFCMGLKSQIPEDIEFEAFTWRGSNSFQARVQAKNTLIRALENRVDNTSLGICGHSHGGNIIAYALNARPDLAKRIVGAVFLSTPFLVYRLVPGWRMIIDGLLAPIGLLLPLLVLMSMYWIGGWFRIDNQSGWSFAGIVTLMTVIHFFLYGTAISTLILFNRWKIRYMHALLRSALRLSSKLSSEMPAETKALFIRISGDEASAALSFSQSVAWMVITANTLYARLLGRIWLPFRRARFGNPYVFVAVLGAFCLLNATAWVGYGWYPVVNPDVPPQQHSGVILDYLWEMGWLTGDWFMLFVAIYTTMFVYAVMSVLLISSAAFALPVALFSLNWLTTLAIGRLPLLAGGILQIAVEATPPGEWELLHAHWTRPGAKQPRSLFWRHSNAYADPQLITKIARWFTEQLKARPGPH
jgi:hypothetical protein